MTHDRIPLIKPVIALSVALVAGPITWHMTRHELVTAAAIVLAAIVARRVAANAAARHLERPEVANMISGFDKDERDEEPQDNGDGPVADERHRQQAPPHNPFLDPKPKLGNGQTTTGTDHREPTDPTDGDGDPPQ